MTKKVILLNGVQAFGYKTNLEVNQQYNKCMMEGELARICDVLCAKNEGHNSDSEDTASLEAACDRCRGNFGHSKAVAFN